jgi:hypothetical protein
MGDVLGWAAVPDGVTVKDLFHWPGFCDWYRERIGGEPDANDVDDLMYFDCYTSGGYAEFERWIEAKRKQ